MKLKILLVVIFVNFCSCVQLPSGDFKDALEHERNKPAADNIRRIIESNDDGTIGREPRIWNGQTALLGQFPYQALLYLDATPTTGYICGGSLITYRVVLTAGHCVEPFTTIEVYLGVINRGGSAEWSGSFHHRDAFYHSAYNPYTLVNDIALIYMHTATQSILNSPYISLCPLPIATDASINLVGMSSTASGFGMMNDSPTGQPSQFLRYVSMPVITNAQCQATFGNTSVISSTLCTGAGAGSTCGGDSGGPLTAEVVSGRRVIVGIVSFGAQLGCTLGFPAGFTRVTSYLDWINEHKDLAVVPTTPRPSGASISTKINAVAIIGMALLTFFY